MCRRSSTTQRTGAATGGGGCCDALSGSRPFGFGGQRDQETIAADATVITSPTTQNRRRRCGGRGVAAGLGTATTPGAPDGAQPVADAPPPIDSASPASGSANGCSNRAT